MGAKCEALCTTYVRTRDLYSDRLSPSATATRLPAGFAGLDQPDAWLPPRGAARPERLDRGVDTLPGVGPSLRGKLAKLGVRTIRDLLQYAPRDYQRPLGETPIAARRREFNVKSYDIGSASATADFAPVYPATEDVTPKRLRDLVERALAHARDVVDPLPAALKAEAGLPQRRDALVALHSPRSLEEAEAGRVRLAFDELLVLQLGIARAARAREATVAPALGEPGELIARYRAALPFTLTEHQEQ